MNIRLHLIPDISLRLGMGTDVGYFRGTDSIMSVLPSTDSLKNKRYNISILLNAPSQSGNCATTNYGKVAKPERTIIVHGNGRRKETDTWLAVWSRKFGCITQTLTETALVATRRKKLHKEILRAREHTHSLTHS